ncbi:exodeoxyribonuclease V subunit beta [Photobacterium sanctipauli]|uniref:RecBCD enzyme subunit RecB n=2 Tax=Photobacterium sanctipauli TaxID=1342794 RepID=A0A2T3NE48_9GAMM|nr:exodeoxyribonuclease V subunit beta [Photobacterium sanctipauli]
MCFPLHGNRLIEASAGTGKTFTIASLYLRLLLGHGDSASRFPRELTVDQILVVTFTEAATAELRDRIRRRIHDARIAISRGESDDPVIKPLLEDISDHKSAAAILLQAERQMDEAAIFTIHGFCQRMLTQNAFESGSLFNNEFVTEESHLRAQVAADYWRRNFYPLPRSLASEVRNIWSSPSALLRDINVFLSGAEVEIRAPELEGDLQQLHDDNLARIERVKVLWREGADDFHDIISSSGVNKRSYTKTSLPKALAEVTEWANRDNTGYKLSKALEKFDQQVLFDKTSKGQAPEHPAFVAISELLADKPNVRDPLLAHAIKECRELLSDAKRRKGWLSFDDLLTQLAAALSHDESAMLAARIRNLFPVAMIDEFQDTDPLQYSIFNTVYGEKRQLPEGEEASACGLFMIGDPKQAIYAFRGADIFTYIQARRQVTAHYTLGTNWRSTAEMIEAVNCIFEQPKRPFIYDNDIAFLPVAHSPKAASRGWQLAGVKQPALSFWRQEADEPVKKGDYQQAMAQATAAEIQTILTLSQQNEALLVDGDNTKPINASDISVLVRTGAEGALVRQALAEQGIASVYLSNRDSVFASIEAIDIQRFLGAVLTPEDDRSMRAALASGLFALTAEALDKLNTDEAEWERHVAEFRGYRQLWHSRGVLPMLRHMLSSRAIPEMLLSQNGGERRLTDILHIGELLQQASQTLDSDHGLIRWLAEHIEAPNGNADEQQLRLESDRNLVQIVTIHKSKGLEYDLVFLPFVCSYREAGTALFHDEQTQQAVLDIAAVEESMELAEKERLAEDLRLIYVALTRAVYGCYIGMSPVRKGLSRKEPTGLHQSAIGWLVQDGEEGGLFELDNALAGLANASSAIRVVAPPQLPETPWQPVEEEQPELVAASFDTELDRSWWITSYSGLVKQGHSHHDASFELPGFDTDSSQDAEDGEEAEPVRSIYTFPKGARPGTFLHTLFEEIEFTAPVDSEQTTEKILELLRLENYDEEWLPVLQQMVGDVLSCPLDGNDLLLGSLPPSQRLTEMEFMLPINVLSAPLLNKVIARHDELSARAGELGFATVSGMLKGFIDLVFEHQGRYYVLDWKSNWLGDDPEVYRDEKLKAAMADHRYDLQYQLYALALHRFLKSRKPDYDYDTHFGGVYYLFLRGVKANSSSGIFQARPSLAMLTDLESLIDGELIDA